MNHTEKKIKEKDKIPCNCKWCEERNTEFREFAYKIKKQEHLNTYTYHK